MKEAIKNLKTSTAPQRFQPICKTMLSYCLKCRKKQMVKTQKLQRKLKKCYDFIKICNVGWLKIEFYEKSKYIKGYYVT